MDQAFVERGFERRVLLDPDRGFVQAGIRAVVEELRPNRNAEFHHERTDVRAGA
ncbi:MAG: hypothetical protein ABIP39_15195 [Polyangiaceae bacterium]